MTLALASARAGPTPRARRRCRPWTHHRAYSAHRRSTDLLHVGSGFGSRARRRPARACRGSFTVEVGGFSPHLGERSLSAGGGRERPSVEFRLGILLRITSTRASCRPWTSGADLSRPPRPTALAHARTTDLNADSGVLAAAVPTARTRRVHPESRPHDALHLTARSGRRVAHYAPELLASSTCSAAPRSSSPDAGLASSGPRQSAAKLCRGVSPSRGPKARSRSSTIRP